MRLSNELSSRSVQAPLAEVAGKVAFITGGSSGIGLGMARAFYAAGMKVVFTYMREEHRDQALSLFPKNHPGIHAIRLDTTDREGFARAADEAERVFGNVHLLCNNAGIGIRAPLSNATWDDWDWAIDVNITGVFNGIRTFLPRMKAHGEGAHILSTSSAGGLAAGTVGLYCTTKFAVMGMMEALRAELVGQNIGVSVLCPGLVTSDIANTNRNRPPRFANSAEGSSELPKLSSGKPMPDFASMSMDPLEAGEMALAGIRCNDLFIITHQEFAGILRERYDALAGSLPLEPAPQDRVDAVDLYLTDIYRIEATRKQLQKS